MTGAAPARPTAVVFDLDGTLLDTMTSTPAAYADTIRALGGPVVSPADVVAAWHIGATPVVLGHFLGRSAVAEDIECFHRHFETTVAGIRSLLRACRLLGVPVAGTAYVGDAEVDLRCAEAAGAIPARMLGRVDPGGRRRVVGGPPSGRGPRPAHRGEPTTQPLMAGAEPGGRPARSVDRPAVRRRPAGPGR